MLLLMDFGCLGLARMRTRKSKGKEKEKEEGAEGEPEAGEDRATGATKRDDADIDEDQDEDGGVKITEKVTGGAEKAGDAASTAALAETKQGKKKKKTSACQFHPGRVINKVLLLLLINLRI